MLKKPASQKSNRYQLAKDSWRKQQTNRRRMRGVLFVILGVLSAGFGLKGFLMPNDFIDGGVTGISLFIKCKN